MSDPVRRAATQAHIQIEPPSHTGQGADKSNVHSNAINGAATANRSRTRYLAITHSPQQPGATAAPGPLSRLKNAQTVLSRTCEALDELQSAISGISPDLRVAKKEIETLRRDRAELKEQLNRVRDEREKARAERDRARVQRDKAKADRDEARKRRDEFLAKAVLQEFRHAYRKREVYLYKQALKSWLFYPIRFLANRAIKRCEKYERKIIEDSGLFDANYYVTLVPEAHRDPLGHFLRSGALDGKNPSDSFDVTKYLKQNKECRRTGINPLVHYILKRREEVQNAGFVDDHSRRDLVPQLVRSTLPGFRLKASSGQDSVKQAQKRIEVIRGKLLSLGFTEKPLAELANIADDDPDPLARAFAARELALWHMRAKTESGYRTALKFIAHARKSASEPKLLSRLTTVELLCHYHLGQEAEARTTYQRAIDNDEIDANVILAWANFQPTAEARIAQINRVLKEHDIAPVTLTYDNSKPPYDRLTSARPFEKISDGPLVTVLVAAYDAADTLPTALRSLQEQTWQNLEIIVIDDCSPTDETAAVVEHFAANDPRIRLMRMPENRGAYVARNAGLDAAAGTFVTLHDADDWSHPAKIETQVRFLQKNAKVMGCTTRQARATSELTFTRWTGEGHFLITNTSSFMFRRAEMRATFGYWDTVRFSADNELIRRMQAKWGKQAIKHLKTGPLSFQRDSDSSIVSDEALGINGFLFGARKEYRDAQHYHHTRLPDLYYDGRPDQHPFPVPYLMKAIQTAGHSRHFPVVLASDFRMRGGSAMSCAEELKCARVANIKTGVFEMYRYDLGDRTRSSMLDEIREQIDGETIEVITFGENITCDLLILRYPPILQHRLRYIPNIRTGDIRVIVNQPPMSDYSEHGVVRYNLADCATNIRHYFGKDATWHPIGPLVRDALLTHHSDQLQYIQLADKDWHNIIDVKGWWHRHRKRSPDGKLRIGRHSRDSRHKWPPLDTDVRAIYPEADDIEVHILGGARVPESILGYRPKNWIVHDFGAMHPRDFLAQVDVWVYFSHPDWVESFGRTIIEAMAAGVPVILPETYRPLFKDAALYATPQTAVTMARMLHADPETYDDQVAKALLFVKEQFSYEMHIKRLAAAGVATT